MSIQFHKLLFCYFSQNEIRKNAYLLGFILSIIYSNCLSFFVHIYGKPILNTNYANKVGMSKIARHKRPFQKGLPTSE